jgi:metal-dependent amidase/aminoacylase/carboxypeptidase family protein
MTDSTKIIGVYFVENKELLEKIKSDIQSEILNIINSTNASIEIEYLPFHSATINTHKETELVLSTAKSLFSPRKVVGLTQALTASEDFSEYLIHVPVNFFLIGAGIDSPPVHTNQFDFLDSIIPIASKSMCQITINY